MHFWNTLKHVWKLSSIKGPYYIIEAIQNNKGFLKSLIEAISEPINIYYYNR